MPTRQLLDARVEIALAIRRQREANKLSQKELGAKLKTSQPRIAKIERAAADVSLDHSSRFCGRGRQVRRKVFQSKPQEGKVSKSSGKSGSEGGDLKLGGTAQTGYVRKTTATLPPTNRADYTPSRAGWYSNGMKTHTEYLTFNVPARMGFVNITPQVEEAVRKSGVQEGLCLVNAMHITASVFINDDEPGLHDDYKKWLEQLAPFDASPAALPPQPHRRGQRRRPPEAADHGPRGRRGDHRRASSTSARGSRSSTASSTAAGRSGCWSRSSGSRVRGSVISVAEGAVLYSGSFMHGRRWSLHASYWESTWCGELVAASRPL